MAGFTLTKLALGNFHYKNYPLTYFLESACRLGIESIELWAAAPHLYVYDYDKEMIGGLKKELHTRNLNLICFTPEQCVYPTNLSSREEYIRKRSVDYFIRSIEVSEELGCGMMVVTPGQDYFNEDLGEAWKRCRDSLETLSREAEKRGVILVLEPLPLYMTHIINGVAELAKMLREVSSPYLKGMLDTDQMAVYGKDSVANYLSTLGSDLRHVHFIDGRPGGHLVPGDGKLPMERYLFDLLRGGYSGYLSLEILDNNYVTHPESASKDSIRWMADHIRNS
ncbi:MAG TPA: sugar phosphate isomerase/epimerase family protein [Clostridia bacterium]|nr:sugar phosphate isomerase/epimerase family protein [Clostridia bacterium]